MSLSESVVCVKQKKQRPKAVTAEANGVLYKQGNFWRIEKIDVQVNVDTKGVDTTGIDKDIQNDGPEVFEDYCIVTQSIRDGIPITLSVNNMNGSRLQ